MDLLCLGGKVGDYEIGIFKTGIPQQFSPAVSPGITTLSDFRVKAYFEQKENLEYSLGELFFGRPTPWRSQLITVGQV